MKKPADLIVLYERITWNKPKADNAEYGEYIFHDGFDIKELIYIVDVTILSNINPVKLERF